MYIISLHNTKYVEQSKVCTVSFQICSTQPNHMGQFLQDGKNRCFVSHFLFTESLCVAKPCKIKLIFQLILVDWVL